jgi:hypothetical protein
MNYPKLRKGHKGKFHIDVVEEKETYKKKSGKTPIDQETRKEYYLVSALTDSLKDSAKLWLVDSGASRHMTGDKNVLADFKQVQFSSQVELGDDASYAIKGIGSTSFQMVSGVFLQIENIHYVPGLTKNLISVEVLEDKGHRVIFMDKRALLWPKDTKLSLAIVIGIKEGGLYKVLGTLRHWFTAPSVHANCGIEDLGIFTSKRFPTFRKW